MSPARTESPPADLLGLHLCRTGADLDRLLGQQLQRHLAPRPFTLALHSGADRRLVVRVGGGAGAAGSPLPTAAVAGWTRLPVRYQHHELGGLFVDGDLDAAALETLAELLAHFGAALANLTIGAEARNASEHYCASLQALEEGIVLFQESDREAVLARLLSLLAAMVHAHAGALFVLREAGDAASPLELAQLHSMPESMLQDLRAADGSAWAAAFLQQNAFLARRRDDEQLGGLDPASVPAVVHNLLSVPLRYLGVDTGLCILFNVDDDEDKTRDLLERVTSFGRLGAAVLHRLQLEAITANQKSIQRELQIAAAIQERLLPREAPSIDRLDFAWHSLSANNIGGDYLDFVTNDLGDLCAIIADASGHGINSALLMSSFRSTYRAEAPWLVPDQLCRQLNAEVVHEVGATGMFITASAFHIDRRSLRLTIASAGHNPILLYRAAADTVTMIESHGPPLGFTEQAEFGSENHQLGVGDVILLYTDGVTEACNQDFDMFGEERLVAILRDRHARAPHEILQAVLAELAAFTGRHRYDDDVSLSIVKIVPPTPA